MVNGPDRVYVERRGRIEPSEVRFADEEALRNAIERILAPLGRRVDELSPMADARLADGSRVNVVIPPLAIDGPAVSIRRFGASRARARSAWSSSARSRAEMRDLLAVAVAERRSVLVSGGTGSGKTTLLNALSSFIARARADRDDRGRRRAAAAASPRRPPREQAGERRRTRRGHDPRPAPQRAAHAARPDRDRRGPGRRGTRPAQRPQHRPRGRALDRPCQLAGRRAAPARDAGADGRRRAAARRRPRAASARAST